MQSKILSQATVVTDSKYKQPVVKDDVIVSFFVIGCGITTKQTFSSTDIN